MSPRATNYVKQNELYSEEKVEAKQCDLVKDDIPFEPETAQFAQFIFVLSGISPEHHGPVVKKIYDQLAPGAVLFLRDYGKYDMAQLRFASRGNQKLKDNFYVASDRTRRYYFTVDEITELFGKQGGFEVIEVKNHYRMVENRKESKTMHRVWIQARFRKPMYQNSISPELVLSPAKKEDSSEKSLEMEKSEDPEPVVIVQVEEEELIEETVSLVQQDEETKSLE